MHRQASFVVLGTAATERVLFAEGTEWQEKNRVVRSRTCVGGSALNVGAHLAALAESNTAYILCQHDPESPEWQGIRDFVRESVGGRAEFAAPARPALHDHTTVVTNERSRITLTEERGGDPDDTFEGFLQEIEEGRYRRADALVLGHIKGENGATRVKEIARAFKDRTEVNGLVVTLPGSTQISAGLDVFRDELAEGVFDIVQLNRRESLRFTGETDWIVAFELLGDLCPFLIVTFSAFGALAGGRDARWAPEGRFFFTQPSLITSEFVDGTGSGDAFAAGFVHEIVAARRADETEGVDPSRVRRALDFARSCGARACTHAGGIGELRAAATGTRPLALAEEVSREAVEIAPTAWVERKFLRQVNGLYRLGEG